MSIVKIPQVLDASLDPVPALVTVYLVDATKRHRIGWQASTGSIIAEWREVPFSDDLLLDLVPQGDISIDSSRTPSYYRFIVDAGDYGTATWDAQVPESETQLDLADLVAATAIPPGSVLAGRLLPSATEGQFAVFTNGEWVGTTVEPGGGVPEAPVDGSAYARKDGDWAAEAGATGDAYATSHESAYQHSLIATAVQPAALAAAIDARIAAMQTAGTLPPDPTGLANGTLIQVSSGAYVTLT